MLPALADGPANATVADMVGRRPPGGRGPDRRDGAGDRGSGGLLMGEVRRRSGSLLAPVLLHWAVNGLGALVAALTATGGFSRPSAITRMASGTRR